MAKAPAKEIEVIAPLVVVDPDTGSATVLCRTNGEPIQLYLAADVFLFLRDQIEQMLAQARHGGQRMLPAAVGCRGLEVGIPPAQLQIRLVLENGSEARLPIQESALLRLKNDLVGWFAQEDQD